MARIRTIKPEFFTSEDIVSMSPLARLLYIALWCEADKEGRLRWKPATFKMRYLPGDKCDIRALCQELITQGLVRLYGEDLAYIPGFSRHQHVNPRESASDLPVPDGMKDAGPKKIGKAAREAVFERDGYKCVRCESTESLQVDHILPQSCGGPHIVENLRLLCRSCNAGRPVAGKALEADLAKDGFTIESLRNKFGIDASISDVHAQVGREGKGREGKAYVEANASTSPPGALPDDLGAEDLPQDPKDYTIPDCPVAEVVELYHQRCPTLNRVEVVNEFRRGLVRSRWRDVCAEERLDRAGALAWWGDYFAHVNRSAFLLGKTPGKPGSPPFKADFEWLVRPQNFVRVVELRYHREAA